MDFQTQHHMVKWKNIWKKSGLLVKTYSSFDKEIAINDRCEMFYLNVGCSHNNKNNHYSLEITYEGRRRWRKVIGIL